MGDGATSLLMLALVLVWFGTLALVANSGYQRGYADGITFATQQSLDNKPKAAPAKTDIWLGQHGLGPRLHTRGSNSRGGDSAERDGSAAVG